MEWIKYLLEANLYLVLFYAAYYLLMRRETYYQLNRVYLLSSSVFAFVIPLLQLGFLKPVPGQIMHADMVAPYTGQIPTPAAPAHLNYYLLIYVIVATALAIGFGIRIFQLIRLSRRGKHMVIKNLKIIEIEENDRAFSFFNYLFIGKNLTTSDTVIRHEMVHIEQQHSMDIIYLELLKIVCWFNPFVYLMQHSIKELHEFIADSHVSATGQDVGAYTDFLVSNAYGVAETSLTNNFFNKNLLKARIIMLHQERSGSLARLKYLVALPLLVGMLCLSTLGFTKDYPVIDLAARRKPIYEHKTSLSTLRVTIQNKDHLKPQTVKPDHKNTSRDSKLILDVKKDKPINPNTTSNLKSIKPSNNIDQNNYAGDTTKHHSLSFSVDDSTTSAAKPKLIEVTIIPPRNYTDFAGKLILINGKEVTDNVIKNLSVANVASMTPFSADDDSSFGGSFKQIYGDKAKNGVIWITLKK